MFKGYPGSSNTSQATIIEYCQQFVKYPSSFLKRVIDSFLRGSVSSPRNSEFVPSIETISRRISTMPMTDAENAEYRRLNGLPLAIEHRPEPEPRRTMPDQVRSTRHEVVERFQANESRMEHVLSGTPLGRRLERQRTQAKGLTVIATGVTLEQFREGAKKHEWGVGSWYAPMLQTVYSGKRESVE